MNFSRDTKGNFNSPRCGEKSNFYHERQSSTIEKYNKFYRVKIDKNLMSQKKSFLFTAYLFGHTSLLIALVL